jgi:hypothetical protein
MVKPPPLPGLEPASQLIILFGVGGVTPPNPAKKGKCKKKSNENNKKVQMQETYGSQIKKRENISEIKGNETPVFRLKRTLFSSQVMSKHAQKAITRI